MRRVAATDTERIHPVIRYAFYVFIFSIPLEYPDRTIPLEVHTITGSLFLATALIQPRLCFKQPHAAFWWLAGFLWIYVARGLFSEHGADVAKLMSNLLLVTFVFWVAQNLLRSTRLARTALVSFIAGCVVIATLQLLRLGATTIEDSMGGMRVTVFDQDENMLGANIALGLIALIGLSAHAIRAHPARRSTTIALAAAPVLLLGHSVLLSGSRGAVIAAISGLLMLPLRPGRAAAVAKRLLAGISIVAILSWLAVSAGPMKSRFASAEGGDLAGREHLYPEAWAMFLEKPLLGWGPIDNTWELGSRTASFAVGGRTEDDEPIDLAKEPHNLLLDLLTTTGLAGAVPLLICLGLCVAMAWRARAGPQGTLPLALMAATLVVGLDVPWLPTKQLWLVCAYAVAAGSCLQARAQQVKAYGGEHARALRRVPVSHLLGNLHRP